LSWEDGRALGGTRTPNLLIRSSGQVVQGRPVVSALWADVPDSSMPDRRRLAAWQQCWQQSSAGLPRRSREALRPSPRSGTLLATAGRALPAREEMTAACSPSPREGPGLRGQRPRESRRIYSSSPAQPSLVQSRTVSLSVRLITSADVADDDAQPIVHVRWAPWNDGPEQPCGVHWRS
jgi:hypothetical protein